MLRVSESLTAVLEALLPSTARVNQPEEGLISSPNNYRLDAATPRLLTHLLFATANNFAGLDGVPIEEIMDYLKRQTNTRLLRQLLSTSGPESEAFAENLFRAAIEAEDARIVEILLEKGLNPNELVCHVGGEKYTPIERSSMMRSVEITRLLLRAKADVNKTVGTRNVCGALQCAFESDYRYYERSRTPVELVSLLLHAGAKVDELILETRIEERDQDVIELLVEFCTKTNPLDLARSRLFAQVTQKFDNEMATRTVMSIFQACLDSAHDITLSFDSTLNTAAKRGNLGLVQFLLHSHVSLTHATLTNAIISQNKDLIRVLIDAGADVDGDCEGLQTPLGAAIRWGDVEIIDLLEHKGVWSHVCEGSGFSSALVAASDVGNLTIVQKLLNLGFNVTGIDLGGALQAAVCGGHEETALILLNAGADVNSYASDEWYDKSNVLLEALQQKNEKLVQLILDADVDIHRRGETALRTAVEWGNHSIIEELIATGADPKAYGLEAAPLAIAVKRKDTESLQLLLDAGAEVNSRELGCKQSTALKAAVTNGDIEMVEYLFSIGADPDDSEALSEALSQGMPMLETLLTKFTRVYPHGKRGYGCGVLLTAIEKADFLLIECLLDAKIDVNTCVCIGDPERPAPWDPSRSALRRNSLGAAIEEANPTSLAILQTLLDRNGNPNSIVQYSINFPYGREAALLTAIGTKDIQKVQLLIDAGADVNRPATKGVKRTPLQRAAEIGSFQIARILIDNGGLVNAQPAWRGGANAIQLAAIGGYIGIAELLLENGADVNAPAARVYGRTALEGAAEHGRIDMLKLLFNVSAKFHGPEYERALQLAKENGHMATRRYLESLSTAPEESIKDMWQ